MKALLIVDDERGSRESLRSIFERTYRVVLADNAGDAQHRMAEERFDLMLLDVMMEKMDGIALLRETRHRRQPPSTNAA